MPIRPKFPIVTGFVNVLLAYRKNARPFAFDPYANASQRYIFDLTGPENEGR